MYFQFSKCTLFFYNHSIVGFEFLTFDKAIGHVSHVRIEMNKVYSIELA